MFSSIAKICLISRGLSKLDPPYIAQACFQASRLLLHQDHTSAEANPCVNAELNVSDEIKPKTATDDKISMLLIRSSLSSSGVGLKNCRNRDNLVIHLFNLSKLVSDSVIKVEDIIVSQTYGELEREIELRVDYLSNAQVVSLLASALKMRLNPTSNLVKILEHEIRFRVRTFTLNQNLKMIKFYSTVEVSSDQKQLVDLLGHRVKEMILNNHITVKELNLALHHIATEQGPKSLLSLIEERLLSLLVIDEDDLVSRYLEQDNKQCYESLCDTYVRLAENQRRPTPVLKALTTHLCKTPIGDAIFTQPKADVIISTLGALITLNYPSVVLVSKLVSDLKQVVNLEELSSDSICSFLRYIARLNWRPEELLEDLYGYIMKNNDAKNVDHNVILNLLYVSAVADYRPTYIREFLEKCMKGPREASLDKNSRKWLNYVWSLTLLDVADEEVLRTVLQTTFYRTLEMNSNSLGINYSDVMKLLNLQAIAKLEFKMDDIDYQQLSGLLDCKIRRSSGNQKFADKVVEALSSVLEDQSCLKYDYQTPFGFVLDCELILNSDLEICSSTREKSLEELLSNPQEDPVQDPRFIRCALIYAFYEDMIANSHGDVVGHKKVIARILSHYGYKTVFLPETILNKEKTSAGFLTKIKSTIKSSVS